jgi:HPt (histidine-containing phosphotransfer) domain-containing protein
MSAAVRKALDARWPRVYEASRAHLATIEAFAAAGSDATTDQRLAARSAAHKLSGSLGMYGRKDASSVAAAIEDLLIIDPAVGDGGAVASLPREAHDELRSLVAALDRLVSLDPAG